MTLHFRGFAAPVSAAGFGPIEDRLRSAGEELADALLIGPRPEFRDALRTRLMAVAAVTPPRTSTLSLWRTEPKSVRRTRLATGALAAAVIMGGAGVAGARSLPGDAFYDLKRASERIELALTHGDAARGQLHLKFAAKRLNEVERLTGVSSTNLSAAGSGQSSSVAGIAGIGDNLSARVNRALTSMDSETGAGARLLTEAFQQTKDRSTMTTLGSFAERQAKRIQNVLGALPAPEQTRALSSLSLVLQVQGQAFVLSATAPIDPTSSNPGDAPTVISTGPTTLKAKHKTPSTTPGYTSTVTYSTPHTAPTPAASPAPEGSTAPPASESPSPSGHKPTPKPTPSGSPAPTPITIGLPLPVPTTCLALPIVVGVCVVPV